MTRPRAASALLAMALFTGAAAACAAPSPEAASGERSANRSGSGSATAGPSSGSATSTTAAADREPASKITLAFGGDVHFEDYVARLLTDPRNSLADLRPTLGAADFAMVNLETALTSGGDRASKTFTFRAPPTALTALKSAGVDAVSLANNHAVDFGATGLRDTLAAKAAGSLPIVGIGPSAREAYEPVYVDVRGTRVALLAALQLWEETATSWSAADGPGVATSHTPASLALLRAATRRAAANADVVVVMMHWGTEYALCADPQQAATARDLETDGADVIVGGHAHRLQGGGWLGRSYVGYSLGNFVWWRSGEPEARSGVLTLTVDAAAARARRTAPAPAPATTATATTPATTGARRTATVVTDARWTPMLIGTDGVPRPPRDSATTTRLRQVWDTAVACSGLRTSPSP